MYYVFGDYVLDTQLHELRHVGGPIQLEPQVFQLLACLVQHRDRALSRQELFNYLWPGHYVSDAALERCISRARRAVGDNGNIQQVIKTLHGHGYRFVAAVEAGTPASPRPRGVIEARRATTMPPLQGVAPTLPIGGTFFRGLHSLQRHTAEKPSQPQAWSCLSFQRRQKTTPAALTAPGRP